VTLTWTGFDEPGGEPGGAPRGRLDDLDEDLGRPPPLDAPAPARRGAAAPFLAEDLNARCADWLPRMAAGDTAALEALYHASLPRLWALARKVLGRDADAEDVLAEVYLQVWRDAARWDAGRGSPLAWLTTICRSRAIDHLRRRDPARLCDEVEELLDSLAASPGDDPGAFGTPGPALDPMQSLAWRQECRGLDAALASLPTAERQLIVLAYYRGLSQSELAEALDLPLGTVKSRTRRALAELRRQLTLELM